MKKEEHYEGYRIVCRSAGRLFAQVFPPGADRPLRDIPVATQIEGVTHLLTQAHNLVDNHRKIVSTSGSVTTPLLSPGQ